MATSAHHQVVIVGGGTAGITMAARLRRKMSDIAVVDPTEQHYYQPLWTLVGGGKATAASTARDEASVMPRGVTWVRESVTGFDPDANAVQLSGGGTLTYEALVVCPGIQLDWARTPGLEDTLGRDGVSSNYRFDLAPRTWDFIRTTTSGTAVFTMPSGPIKCGGAPQKIAYLACDHWRRQGVLDDIDVHLVVPTPRIFGIDVYAKALEKVVADYGIDLHTSAELVEVDADARKAGFAGVGDNSEHFTLPYDMMHVVPHQSAPDFVQQSELSTGGPGGWVDVDKHTLQHVRYPNVFGLGDAASSPNSKTGAAVRKQAPVVAANIVAVLEGREPQARYGGYSSCPIVTSGRRMLLAEFDYSGEPKPSIPFIDTTKPRRDMWLLKKYGLPFLYWNLMLKGRA